MCTRVLFTEATRCIQVDTENSSSGYICVACIGTRLIDQHINFFLFSDPSVYECFSKSTASRFSYVHFDIFSPVVALCARLQSELPGESGANPSNHCTCRHFWWLEEWSCTHVEFIRKWLGPRITVIFRTENFTIFSCYAPTRPKVSSIRYRLQCLGIFHGGLQVIFSIPSSGWDGCAPSH